METRAAIIERKSHCNPTGNISTEYGSKRWKWGGRCPIPQRLPMSVSCSTQSGESQIQGANSIPCGICALYGESQKHRGKSRATPQLRNCVFEVLRTAHSESETARHTSPSRISVWLGQRKYIWYNMVWRICSADHSTGEFGRAGTRNPPGESGCLRFRHLGALLFATVDGRLCKGTSSRTAHAHCTYVVANAALTPDGASETHRREQNSPAPHPVSPVHTERTIVLRCGVRYAA